MTYAEYPQTPHWRTFSRLVKERDGYACVICNGSYELQVHHRTYERGWFNERLEDGYTLCDTCHKVFSKYKRIRGGE